MKKGNQIEVNCETCGKPKIIPEWKYRHNKYKRFYCCVPCKLKGTERKIKTECVYCKNELVIHKSQFNRTKNNYCSIECRSLDSLRLNLKKCDYCGKDLMIQDFRVENNSTHFCDKICLGLFNRKRKIVECDNCGKEIEIHNSSFEAYEKHFCNSECYREFSRGENSHSWMGGLSFIKYSIEFNSRLRKKIRDRDNNRCQICGSRYSHGKRKLSVHHINYDKKDSREENLVSLCNSCHSKTNYNRSIWERWFGSSSSFWFAARCQ